MDELTRRLDPLDKQTLKADTLAHFFQKYSARQDDILSNFIPWKADDFLEDIAKNPALGKNLEAVLGKESYNDLVDLSRIYRVVRPVIIDKKVPVSPRVVMTATGGSAYLAGDLPSYARSKLYAASFMAGQLAGPLRQIATKKQLTEDELVKNLRKVTAGLFAGPRGVESAFLVGRNDPNFMEFIHELMGGEIESLKKQEEFRKQYGTEKRFQKAE